jgi:hypothetical protein
MLFMWYVYMIPQLPNQVIIEMAKRHHRIHHYLWHEVRNNWLDYDDVIKNELRNMGWEPLSMSVMGVVEILHL